MEAKAQLTLGSVVRYLNQFYDGKESVICCSKRSSHRRATGPYLRRSDLVVGRYCELIRHSRECGICEEVHVGSGCCGVGSVDM